MSEYLHFLSRGTYNKLIFLSPLKQTLTRLVQVADVLFEDKWDSRNKKLSYGMKEIWHATRVSNSNGFRAVAPKRI
jgi:hypothetical protein